MAQKIPILRRPSGNFEAVRDRRDPQAHGDRVLEKLSRLELPGKEHFESYRHHKLRVNHKARTIDSAFTSIRFFLDFYGVLGKSDLKDIKRSDLEAFIEHEQDRGLHISSVRTRIATIIAFLHFLIEQDLVPRSCLKKRIRLKLPDTLPRTINTADVKKLIAAIDTVRDRALILLLLRAGVRIGEALGLTLSDIDIEDRKVRLFEGEKNSMGRVVYLSDDVFFALKRWLAERDTNRECVFYTRNNQRMCYSTARSIFVKYMRKAKIEQNGYTVHYLRHTFASELLNAGMRLECLQQLMGHQDIEVTRRYARLTDKTREEEYFRAMAVIEKGGTDGDS